MAKTNSSISNSERRGGWGTLVRGLLGFLPLVIVVAATNWLVDPAHVFSGASFERRVGELLADGQSVSNFDNLNERLVQKYYVDALKEPNDVIVLGSSRSMQVGAEALGGKIRGCRFHNNSVSSASLGDYLAVYQFYRAAGRLPKRVVIGADPWIFNRNSGEYSYLSVADAFQEMKGVIDGHPPVQLGLLPARWLESSRRWFQLFSPSYFQAALETLRKRDHGAGREPVGTREFRPIAEAAIRADGTHWYDEKFRGLDPEEVKREAITRAESKEIYYNMSRFEELDQELKSLFHGFVRALRSDGVEPMLFLSPYYPAIYEKLRVRADMARILEAERFLREFARQEGITVLGSYDPAVSGLTENDFFDWMHPRPSGVAKAFCELKSLCP